MREQNKTKTPQKNKIMMMPFYSIKFLCITIIFCLLLTLRQRFFIIQIFMSTEKNIQYVTNNNAIKLRPADFLNTTFYKSRKSQFHRVKPKGRQFPYHQSQIHDNINQQFQKVDLNFTGFSLINNNIGKTTPLLQIKSKPSKGKRKTSIKKIKFQKSPYLNSSVDMQKMMRLLSPVNGPNESLKLQIKKYNQMNMRNAENHICLKKDNFEQRMVAYSNRLGLNIGAKIFVINSKDYHIKNALLNRNWIQSNDHQSNFYHLKWVYMDNINDYGKIQQGQFYNHFRNNQQLTNKNLFRKNIKKCSYEYRPTFPLSYDLEVNDDQTDFQEQYIKFQAIKLYSKIIRILKIRFQNLYQKVLKNKNFHKYKRSKRSEPNSQTLLLKNNQNLTYLLYKKSISDLKLQRNTWQCLTNLYEFLCYIASIIKKMKGVQYIIFNSLSYDSEKDMFRIIRRIQEEFILNINEWISMLSDFYLVEIFKMWIQIQHYCGKNYGFQNKWILKPTGVSRGSGITITDDYSKINQLKYGKIVQKYLQIPLLLNCERKFDIRQWVMVKSFSPLCFYIFQKCYGRFSSVKYSNNEHQNLQMHLTNYSKNKESFLRMKVFNRSSNSRSVMSQEQFFQQLGSKWLRIKQKMYINIYKTIECCRSEIIQKQGCFQVYGFDVMVDFNYQPWILEVNMSPACENREPFLGQYLEQMAEGVINMIEGQFPRYWLQINEQYIQQLSQKISFQQKRLKAVKTIEQWWLLKKNRKQK